MTRVFATSPSWCTLDVRAEYSESWSGTSFLRGISPEAVVYLDGDTESGVAVGGALGGLALWQAAAIPEAAPSVRGIAGLSWASWAGILLFLAAVAMIAFVFQVFHR